MRARPATLLGLGLVVAALIALLGLAVTNAVVYYVTPTELAASPVNGPVRLYGIVVAGSVTFDRSTGALSFRVSDGQTTETVTSRFLPTALFRDGIGVVLVGRTFGPRAFAADEILIKHSAVYEPLKPGETIPPDILQQIRGGG
ncbi:MAG: cytochrome c maturation protein CcmE [Chloroflexi bacterium]|nr:cytochrome c maturation protein CcmE [Chloroflexota bacterium]MBF6606821.1 cytochrome c maturation protein CcmE [Chloroflexota bacterium]